MQSEAKEAFPLTPLLVDHRQYLFNWVKLLSPSMIFTYENLPVRLSTSTSWSTKVIKRSPADVVEVWSMKFWFHFSFWRRFLCNGIFFRWDCEVTKETDEKSMLSLLSLINPIRRNDQTAKMKRNLKKFLCTLFIFLVFLFPLLLTILSVLWLLQTQQKTDLVIVKINIKTL